MVALPRRTWWSGVVPNKPRRIGTPRADALYTNAGLPPVPSQIGIAMKRSSLHIRQLWWFGAAT